VTVYLPDGTVFEDKTVSFDTNADGLFVKHAQEIPDAHIAGLREERDFNRTHRAGEMHRVASIPVALVEAWLRDGYDIHEMSAKQIIAKLKSEDLDAFVVSDKLGR
jgi:hypothetical protein